MAFIKVPDTDTFNFEDIYQSVNSHNPNVARDLVDCFAKANVLFFDPNSLNAYEANTSLRFRNYTPYELGGVIEFIALYARIDGGASLVFINESGQTKTYTDYYDNESVRVAKAAEYRQSNKLLIVPNQSEYRYVDCTNPDAPNQRWQVVSIGRAGHIRMAGSYWFAGNEGSYNGYRDLISRDWSSISLKSYGIFGGTPPTSGAIRGVVRDISNNRYYYCTSDGEVGWFTTPGGYTYGELTDSPSHSYQGITYLNGYILAYHTTHGGRYAAASAMNSWYTWTIDTGGDESVVVQVMPYDTTRSLVLTLDGRLYAITHGNPPTSAQITGLAGINTITIKDGAIYAAKGYEIYRLGGLSPIYTWGIYTTLDDTQKLLQRIWFY